MRTLRLRASKQLLLLRLAAQELARGRRHSVVPGVKGRDAAIASLPKNTKRIGKLENPAGKADHQCDVLVLEGNTQRYGDRAESCGGRPAGSEKRTTVAVVPSSALEIA
jgi:hypothetical protein